MPVFISLKAKTQICPHHQRLSGAAGPVSAGPDLTGGIFFIQQVTAVQVEIKSIPFIADFGVQETVVLLRPGILHINAHFAETAVQQTDEKTGPEAVCSAQAARLL